MWSEVVVRRARRGDERLRAHIIEEGFADKFKETFIYFLFQELTLQCCVLAGAVLFIFAGSAPLSCALVLPAAALLVAAAVHLTRLAVSTKHVEDMRSELVGFVAEARGPCAGVAVPVRAARADEHDADHFHYRKVVGTVSVSRARAHPSSPAHRPAAPVGWLHDLAVTKQWRGRGAGRALEAAAREAARGLRMRALEAATSELQPEARRLLHARGWELRTTYQRPVLWSALTLPMAHLRLDLPLYT